MHDFTFIVQVKLYLRSVHFVVHDYIGDDCYSCMMVLRVVAFGVILTILLCSPLASSGSDSGCPANTSSQFCYYVTPDSSTPCSTGIPYPCLTLNDYVNETEKFFLNDSTFYFSAGNHRLNIGLNLTGVHNVFFFGDGVGGVTLMIDPLSGADAKVLKLPT